MSSFRHLFHLTGAFKQPKSTFCITYADLPYLLRFVGDIALQRSNGSLNEKEVMAWRGVECLTFKGRQHTSTAI